jgi:hypothetical protein
MWWQCAHLTFYRYIQPVSCGVGSSYHLLLKMIYCHYLGIWSINYKWIILYLSIIYIFFKKIQKVSPKLNFNYLKESVILFSLKIGNLTFFIYMAWSAWKTTQKSSQYCSTQYGLVNAFYSCLFNNEFWVPQHVFCFVGWQSYVLNK